MLFIVLAIICFVSGFILPMILSTFLSPASALRSVGMTRWLIALGMVFIVAAASTERFSMRQYEKDRRKAHARYGPQLANISFSCPGCQRTYTSVQSIAGKPFSCRGCDEQFTVPTDAPVVAEPVSHS